MPIAQGGVDHLTPAPEWAERDRLRALVAEEHASEGMRAFLRTFAELMRHIGEDDRACALLFDVEEAMGLVVAEEVERAMDRVVVCLLDPDPNEPSMTSFRTVRRTELVRQMPRDSGFRPFNDE